MALLGLTLYMSVIPVEGKSPPMTIDTWKAKGVMREALD